MQSTPALVRIAAAIAFTVLGAPRAAAADPAPPGDDAPAERRDDPAPVTGTTQEPLEKLKEKVTALEEDLDSLVGAQDRVTEESHRDRLHWFGDYRLVVNNFYTFERDQGIQKGTFFPDLWSHRLRLAMTWEILDKVRFYGRLVFLKNFGELIEEPLFFDSQTTRWSRDTSLRIERAYIDWFITDWLVFTAGRVAAPEGPPAELKENTVRSATWGVQMVEAEFEVVMLTTYLSAFLPESYLRLFYMPFSSVTDIDVFDEDTIFKDIGIGVMHVLGAQLELKIPGIGQNLVQVGGIFVPEFKPRFLPIFGVFPKAPFPSSLGWFSQISALVELLDIAHSGLDLFAAYNMTLYGPNGELLNYDFGDGFEQGFGLASNGENEHIGHMFYTGLRYTVPVLGDLAPRVGFEYNFGSRLNTMFSSPSDTKINKLGVRGHAFDAYYIQPILPEHLFFRIGFQHIIREFDGSFIGDPIATQTSVSNLYVLLHSAW